MTNNLKPEKHPLEPFLPANVRVLMLGSFPPKRERWSMEFYYPNFQNDMWRIFGLVFFGDKEHFLNPQTKLFDKDLIAGFLSAKGFALYDAAESVIRHKDNASDKFLEIVDRTDIEEMIGRLPQCTAIITTGQKSAETVAEIFGVKVPPVGGSVEIKYGIRSLLFFRAPSSSRAYPLAVTKKAEIYSRIFQQAGIV